MKQCSKSHCASESALTRAVWSEGGLWDEACLLDEACLDEVCLRLLLLSETSIKGPRRKTHAIYRLTGIRSSHISAGISESKSKFSIIAGTTHGGILEGEGPVACLSLPPEDIGDT